MTVRDTADIEVLSWIPIDAWTILDVGCGEGDLGAEYKRRNPRAKIYGIETSEAAAQRARYRLDRVYTSDININPLPFANDVAAGTFDCLIYNGVLNKLLNPWTVLQRHVEFLAADGTVLVCGKNFEHWSIAERLLKGNLCYEREGSLESGRLRWFTAEGVKQLLHDCGLMSVECEPQTSDHQEAASFADLLAPGLSALGIDPAAYLRRAAPTHLVWRAQHRRNPTRKLTIVSTMLSPVGGVSDVRVVEPMQALKADPGLAINIITNTDAPPIDAAEARIMILHRPLLAGDAGLEKVKNLLARKWLVICEFDDHPDYIPVLQRPDIQNFRAVHAIQTTTEPLAAVLRTYNPEVIVFENAMARLPSAQNFLDENQVKMLFAGLNRESEWPYYIESINTLASRFGSRLHFEIINDRAFFDALQTKHKTFSPLCDYDTYREILSKSEISFMPLSDTPFNRCKSDLKYIEAAAHRVVALASKVVYQGTIEDGRTGVLFDTPQDLENVVSRLVMDPMGARSIADAGRQYIQDERMLAYQLSKRAAWYRSLWTRREDLNRALLSRVPELA